MASPGETGRVGSIRPDSIRFDVFGRLMLVERRGAAWELYQLGADGKRSPLRDAVIPESLSADELGRYLGDLFHEYASARHPDVKRLAAG